MSGDENELPGSALSSTEPGKARRFLLWFPTFFSALPLIALGSRLPEVGPLGLTLHTLPVALVFGSVILQRSRPQGSERALIPRNLRHIARLAEVPELGAMIMVYGSVVVAMTICTLSTAAIFATPQGRAPLISPGTVRQQVFRALSGNRCVFAPCPRLAQSPGNSRLVAGPGGVRTLQIALQCGSNRSRL
jgi:hypothetical protein